MHYSYSLQISLNGINLNDINKLINKLTRSKHIKYVILSINVFMN